MVIYNLLTELTAMQVLLIASSCTIIIGLQLYAAEAYPNMLFLILAVGVGIEISFLTALIGQGGYMGMAFTEKFGWPIHYLEVSRHIDPDLAVAQIFIKTFDFFRFGLNSIYWAILVVSIIVAVFAKRLKLQMALAIILVILFASSTMYFSTQNKKLQTEVYLEESSFLIPNDKVTPHTAKKLEAIEVEYPNFKDFSNQESFAGQSIVHSVLGNDEYFVFMAHGSGIPIIKATCFKVDRMFRVYKTGEFPDFLDSYAGYSKIDPVTCTGTKDF